MNKSIKNVLVMVAFFAMAAMISSCNRGGYGCPYELSLPTINICR